jgi:FHA domain
MSRPVLEFLSAQRAPFQLTINDVTIGRSPNCTLILDAAGVGDRHARINIDAAGNAYIENFEPDAFTMYNGTRLTGRQKLNEGDRIEIGLAQLVYHATLDIAVASAAPAGAKAASADRTMIGSEMPAELKKFLENRNVGGAAAAAPPQPQRPLSADAWDTAPPTVADPQATAKALKEMRAGAPQRTMQVDLNNQILEDRAAGGGVVVGTPEPEPESHRTVTMSPVEVANLGLDAASLAGAGPSQPAPTPAPAQARPQFKQTMMGIGTPVAKSPPAGAPPQKSAPQQATAFMEAPKLAGQQPAAPPAPQKSAPQQATAFMEAPKLPQQAAQKSAPQQATAFMEAPKLPPQAAVHAPQSQFPPPDQMPKPTPAPMPVAAPMPMATAAMPAPAQQPMMAAAAPAPMPSGGAIPYTPPKSKGSFGSFSRAFEFMSQIFNMAKGNKDLFKPLIWDLTITTPIMFVFTILDFIVWRFLHSPTLSWVVLGVEAGLLYFVDYLCNSITCSLIYDYATTGQATTQSAIPRVKKALPGIITFAAVSGLLDVATTYARERNDVVSRIILNILRKIWTTATYVIMPALVIEGVSFGAAFGRSKKLMAQDPTGVGAGVVSLYIVSYVVAAICFPLAYFIMGLLAHIPVIGVPLGAFIGMGIINLYWSVSGWMKISYSTCFYLWARECEQAGRQDHALAPAPLRAALEAA